MPRSTVWLAVLIALVFTGGVVGAVVESEDDDDDSEQVAEGEGGDDTTTTTEKKEEDPVTDRSSTTSTTRPTTTTTQASTTSTAAGSTGGTTTTRPRTTTTSTSTTTTAAPANESDLSVGISRNGNGTNSSTYTVRLTDLGPGDSGPASITVVAPAGVRLCRSTVVDGDGNCSANAPSSLTVSGIDVPEAGAFIGVRAEGAEGCEGPVTVTGTATAPDPRPSNNSASAAGPGC